MSFDKARRARRAEVPGPGAHSHGESMADMR